MRPLRSARASFDDMRRRGKIRFAAHQRDQRLPLRLAFAHLGENRVHGGGLQFRDSRHILDVTLILMSLSEGLADDLRPSLRLGEDSAFGCVRDFLDHCGYTSEAAANRIGFAKLDHLAQYTLCDQAKRERNLRIRDPLNAAVKLFLCGQIMDEAQLSGLVPAEVLAAMEALGLVEREGAKLFSPVLLYPAHGLYLASDRYMNPDGSPVSTGHNFVFLALQRNATDFIASLPGTPCDTFLDLGSGCGVAGLWAANNLTTKVWSTDINPRATHFAEFNRRLNRIDNVTIGVGDLYEPVRDLRFDRIACHPPYAMTTKPGYIYADGGEDGEVLLRRVIEGAPAHLTPGGILTSFQVATDREGETLEQRVRGWLGEQNGEFDVAVMIDEYLEPLTYAAGAITNGVSAPGELAQVRDLFARLRVERIVYGAVFVRRHARPGIAPFTVRRVRSSQTTRPAITWMLDWEAAAAQPTRDSLLLGAQPQASPHAELNVRHRFRDGSLQPVDYTFRTAVPFNTVLAGRSWIAYLFSRSDGQLTGAELFERVAPHLPEGADQKYFLDALSALISGGFLEIDAFRPPTAV